MDPAAAHQVYAETYHQYLQHHHALPAAGSAVRQALDQQLAQTRWDAPQSPEDYYRGAVLALVMAEEAEEAYLRGLYLNTALEALEMAGQRPGPLASQVAAQRAAVALLLQEPNAAGQAFSALLAAPLEESPPEPLYLPPTAPQTLRGDLLQRILAAETAQQQAQLLAVETLRRSPLAFYSAQGLRFLQLAVQHFPQIPQLQIQLGLANLFSDRLEGLVNLRQAAASGSAAAHQALHLAYRPLSPPESAQWHQAGAALAEGSPVWRWTDLPVDNPITYIPYEGMLLAVEASLRSIVTSVLLAQEDWFEAELTLWRQQLQPGMVVIDVGANVGVYSFSAAAQVGRTGRVIAVEPFAGCANCLRETCHLNNLDWVTVCEAAASDRLGTAQLALHSASELNELVTDGETKGIAVPCTTLDTLVEEHQLQRVDWLKIDAEGHELPVLRGAAALLARFRPKILYENVAAGQGANLAVGQWLQQSGYQLYRYQPFMGELAPVEDVTQAQRSLNLVALPAQ